MFLRLLKSEVGFCRKAKRGDTTGAMARTGRPPLIHKRSDYLKANAYPQERRAFDEACKKAKISSSDALRMLAAAWASYVERTPRPSLHVEVRSLDE